MITGAVELGLSAFSQIEVRESPLAMIPDGTRVVVHVDLTVEQAWSIATHLHRHSRRLHFHLQGGPGIVEAWIAVVTSPEAYLEAKAERDLRSPWSVQ